MRKRVDSEDHTDAIGETMGVGRPQKVTFAEMREQGVRGIVVYCADCKRSHG